jgi:hypothetical protein
MYGNTCACLCPENVQEEIDPNCKGHCFEEIEVEQKEVLLFIVDMVNYLKQSPCLPTGNKVKQIMILAHSRLIQSCLKRKRCLIIRWRHFLALCT